MFPDSIPRNGKNGHPNGPNGKPVSLARCYRCSQLFLIRGKDPGWLSCHHCSHSADSGVFVLRISKPIDPAESLIEMYAPALDKSCVLYPAMPPDPDYNEKSGSFMERSYRDPKSPAGALPHTPFDFKGGPRE